MGRNMITGWCYRNCKRKFIKYHDLALIKLKEPFTSNSHPLHKISKVPFLANNTCPAGTDIELSGWGYTGTTDEEGRLIKAIHLQKTLLKVKDWNQCSKKVYNSTIALYNHYKGQDVRVFCAADQDNQKSKPCKADSGSPYVKDDILVGVHSFGFGICRRNSSRPIKRWEWDVGVSNVAHSEFKRWIQSHLESDGSTVEFKTCTQNPK